MPRAVDLSQAPPPEASCYACRQLVKLDRRARSRGKFRCPVCRSDNRVGADGLGQPLSGEAEHLDEMPQVRCTGCGATNRLPFRLLQGGSYTCHACRAAQPVPKTLRKRAGVVSQWAVATLLFVILVSSIWAVLRTASTAREFAQPWWMPREGPAAVEQALRIEDAKPSGSTAEGDVYVVTGELINPFGIPTTFHVRVELYEGERAALARTVSLVAVKPNETRRFRVRVVDRRRRRIGAAAVSLVGVS